jgi:hypothetical protein
MTNQQNPSLDLIAKMIQTALSEHLGKDKPKATAAKSASGGDGRAEMKKLVISAFRRAGFGTVLPRVDVKTFNLWKAEGLVPKRGERATKCRQFNLFHRSQLEPIPVEAAVATPVIELAKPHKKPRTGNANKATLHLFPTEPTPAA